MVASGFWDWQDFLPCAEPNVEAVAQRAQLGPPEHSPLRGSNPQVAPCGFLVLAGRNQEQLCIDRINGSVQACTLPAATPAQARSSCIMGWQRLHSAAAVDVQPCPSEVLWPPPGMHEGLLHKLYYYILQGVAALLSQGCASADQVSGHVGVLFGNFTCIKILSKASSIVSSQVSSHMHPRLYVPVLQAAFLSSSGSSAKSDLH